MVNQRHQATKHPVATTRKLAIAGLITAAAGIIVQMAGGADYPAVPPGAIILVAAAGLFALRKRWAPLVGVAVPVFLTVGAVVTPNMGDQLADTAEATVFTGTVIQLVGLAAGLICGLTVAVRTVREGRTA